jgi:hypothetical protein
VHLQLQRLTRLYRAAAAAPAWRRPLPYPYELVTVVALVTGVGFLRWQGMGIDWQTVEYTVYPMFRSLPAALAGGIALQAVYQLLRRRSVKSYLRAVASADWIALWLRLWLVCMAWTYLYFWLKVCVPLINPRLLDGALWRLDTALHLGVSPSVFLVEALSDSWAVPLIDGWYALWIASVFWTTAFFSAAADPLLRRRFMLSCVLLWTAGAWVYLALPALGPVYVQPELWRPLIGRIPGAEAGQAALWENYQRMLAGRESGVLQRFNPTRGIAAMPSLHVGAHWLFALWARRAARPLWAPFVAATLLTLLGSVLLGWHYAVDGYVGMLLAWASLLAAVALERPPAGRPATPEPETVAAVDTPEPTGTPTVKDDAADPAGAR